jgi:CTP synthase
MKYIFVTGGVVSSIGKGLTAASLGALLELRGFAINLQKFDPYLNVDPGTLSPFQHGEVYVLDDGAETDLDLGHYERFTNVHLSRKNSVTSGQIYETVIKKERHGDYLGKTVQVIPHITDEIKQRILNGARPDTDILITEIGGTIGDIEGLPFLEAMRQWAIEIGKENILFIHMTLLPYLKAAGELKTKPSQQSVAKLREIGIQPDILICRTEVPMDMDTRKKLSLFCNVSVDAVIEEQDVAFSIYELPMLLRRESLDTLVLERLQLPCGELKTPNPWESVIHHLKYPKRTTNIAIVGKYIGLQDAYKSIYESLVHAGIANDCAVNSIKIDSEVLTDDNIAEALQNVDGILIPGGFGGRGFEGKIAAVKYAREHNIPFFGICLGMQIAVIEFARNVANLSLANSTEADPDTPHPVIDIMEHQKIVQQKGGSMRLGSQPCQLDPDSFAYRAYQQPLIHERHRHRFEFNNAYRSAFELLGLKISGMHADLNLVEIIEIPNHPWFLGVQFHPEFQSKPMCAHPLFTSFIGTALILSGGFVARKL